MSHTLIVFPEDAGPGDTRQTMRRLAGQRLDSRQRTGLRTGLDREAIERKMKH